jgi:uncharacterized RDD family membrane protein YckC
VSDPLFEPDLPGEVAGLGRRVGALAIDWAASTVVAMILLRGAAYTSPEVSAGTFAVFAVELVILTWLVGASFGQRLVGLRVIGIDGRPLGLGRVALRTLLICLVVPALVMDSQGRGLHDRAARSVVVRADSLTR